MYVSKKAKFDGQKFKADLAKNGFSLSSVADKLGCSSSTMTASVRQNEMPARRFRAICEMFGLDEIDYLLLADPKEEPEQAPAAEPAASASLDTDSIARQLGEISKKLDKLVEVLKVRHPVFAKIEDCILILQALTKYGSCNYKTFEDKARASGMDEETMACALNITGYRVFIGDGIKQISRK